MLRLVGAAIFLFVNKQCHFSDTFHIFRIIFSIRKRKMQLIPREARAEGPSVARLINLAAEGRSGARVSGAEPRAIERRIYLYIYIYYSSKCGNKDNHYIYI